MTYRIATESWPRGMIIFARVICPFILAATFALMEVALAYEKGISGFTEGLREFIRGKLFVPFFMGVLMGHWFHPVAVWYDILDRRVYKGKQFLPPIIIIVVGALVMGIGWGIFPNEPAPTYVNFVMVVVGLVVGGLLWPVRVLPPSR